MLTEKVFVIVLSIAAVLAFAKFVRKSDATPAEKLVYLVRRPRYQLRHDLVGNLYDSLRRR
jgi:flagellar basal body-associated protein FliL